MIRRSRKIIVVYIIGTVIATLVVLGFVDVQVATERQDGNDVIHTRALKFSRGLPSVAVNTTPVYKSVISGDQLCYGKGVKPSFPKLKDKPLPHLDFKKVKILFIFFTFDIIMPPHFVLFDSKVAASL